MKSILPRKLAGFFVMWVKKLCRTSITDGSVLAKSKFGISAALLSGALLLCGCGEEQEPFYRHSATDTAMGTIVNMTVYSTVLKEEELKAVQVELFREVDRLEKDMLSWRLDTSELYLIQSASRQDGAALSEEMRELLQSCREVAQNARGAFSVTVGALTRLWNMDEQAAAEKPVLPSKEEIENALAVCGEEKLRISDGRIFLEQGTMLDLGAVGKGYALDRIREMLDGESPDRRISGVFSLGGSILTFGTKPDGSSWKVAVVDPSATDKTVGYLELQGSWCVSTSGDYERFFEKDGVCYHHLLDPSTGYPAGSGLRSVTILSESGLLSDALSTACFVLGKEGGMELAEKYGAGILTVDESGAISCNAEMEKCFHGTKQEESAEGNGL